MIHCKEYKNTKVLKFLLSNELENFHIHVMVESGFCSISGYGSCDSLTTTLNQLGTITIVSTKRSESIVITQLMRALLTILRNDCMVLSNTFLFSACPEGDSNLDQSRIAVFENCKATALATQP